MTYKYGRYHEDGLGDYNYQFMQKEGDKVPQINFLPISTGTRKRMTTP